MQRILGFFSGVLAIIALGYALTAGYLAFADGITAINCAIISFVTAFIASILKNIVGTTSEQNNKEESPLSKYRL